MTAFRLHRVTSHPNDQDTYRVTLTLEDGYELEAGGIKRDTGSNQRIFWAWSIGVLRKVPGITGQCDTRGEAMERVRAAWDRLVTAEDVSEMRHHPESRAKRGGREGQRSVTTTTQFGRRFPRSGGSTETEVEKAPKKRPPSEATLTGQYRPQRSLGLLAGLHAASPFHWVVSHRHQSLNNEKGRSNRNSCGDHQAECGHQYLALAHFR